jgi:hypothetical protein
VAVVLHEMRPVRSTPAHKTGDLAELVCSNSLRSDDPVHAAGLLKREMEAFGSLIIAAARAAAVPAGGALAVDREVFARRVTSALAGEELVEVRREELLEIPAVRGVAHAGDAVDAARSAVHAFGARGARRSAQSADSLLATRGAIGPVGDARCSESFAGREVPFRSPTLDSKWAIRDSRFMSTS